MSTSSPSAPESPAPWTEALHAAQTHIQAGTFEAAILPLRQASEIARREDAPGPEASALGLLAQILLQLTRGEESLEAATRALQIAKTVKDEDAQADFQALIEQAKTAINHAPVLKILKEANQELADEKYLSALDHYQLALDALDDNNPHLSAQIHAMRAQALYAEERKEEAQTALGLALEFGTQTQDDELINQIHELASALSHEPPSWLPLIDAARTALHDQQPEAALAPLTSAIEATTEAEAKGPEATARGLISVALANLQRNSEAIPHAERALEIAKELGDRTAFDKLTVLLDTLKGTAPSS